MLRPPKVEELRPFPPGSSFALSGLVKLLLGLLLALFLTGCPSSGVSPEDGGSVVAQDARASIDAGAPDSGVVADAGSIDDAGAAADSGVPADAGLMGDTGERTDTGVVDDAGALADAGLVDDAGFADAAAGADAGCAYPALMIDGPFPAGPPPGSAHLLLTDTSSNAIFRVDLSGLVQNQWRAPVARVYGVAHDKRTTDGFWVGGYPLVGVPGANRPFRRLSFAGAVTATLSYAFFSQDGFHGLDFVLGSDPSLDVLVFTMQNRNIIDTVSGARTTDGARAFEGGALESTSRWYGMQVERYGCDDANSLAFWSTHQSTLVLRDWPTGTELRTYNLPTLDARGVTRTPYGDFFVVDGAQRRVLHLDPMGNLLGAFGAPGPNPSDVSYGE